MSVCVMLLLLSDTVHSDSADEAPPTLSVTVVTAAGEPVNGAHVSVAAKSIDTGQPEEIRFAPDAEIATAVTNADGVATIIAPSAETKYFAYVNAGALGRGYADGLNARRSAEVPVYADPPLRIRFTNVPEKLRDNLRIDEVFETNRRRVQIEHGPFVIDSTDPEIELPNPFGDRLVFANDRDLDSVSVPLPRTLHVNARGGKRVAVVDFADPDSTSYADPALAPSRRIIRVRFRASDGKVADVDTFDFAGKRFVSINGTRFRPGHEPKPNETQGLPFVQSGEDWLMRVPDSEQVSLQFRRTRVSNHVLIGDGDRLIQVGSGDQTIDVMYTPTTAYRWDAASTDWQESEYVRFSWASESLGSATQRLPTHYPANVSETLPTLYLPKNENTLLAVELSAGYLIQLLDGQGGQLLVKEPEIAETTIQARSVDGRLVTTHVEGLVALNSGIAAPLPISTEESWSHRNQSETFFPSTEALLRVACEEPLAAVVRDRDEPWHYAIVPLAIGEHHDVILKPSRSLNVSLMDETGTAFVHSDSYRISLKWRDEFGLQHSQVKAASSVSFRSVPTEGIAELTVLHPSGLENRLQIELPVENRLAVVVERGPNEAIYVTSWPGVTPTPAPRPRTGGGGFFAIGPRAVALHGRQRNQRPLNIHDQRPGVVSKAPVYVLKKPIKLKTLSVAAPKTVRDNDPLGLRRVFQIEQE